MKEYFKQKVVSEKINQGDQDTFLKMYDFYTPKLFRHVYYRTGSKETAEDIVQQVFYKTWQYIMNQDNKIDNINAFLYRSINNLIADHFRKSDRKNIGIDDELERKLPDQSSNSDEDVDRQLDINKVKSGLSKLKPNQQNLITWHYLDDLSYDQIAKITGKSKNAIYVGIHRALKELQQII
ncbi:MAG: hypothetical protein CMI53_05730 [Parcubacteria group bacterium]|nr:hypothetical protein [Parcubacteria group bacterium]|tara:strand:+ start:5144 stop:5686 length:543 start_codon:yes stop_codon:yes gene_type:complete